jgi:hypothetical protein
LGAWIVAFAQYNLLLIFLVSLVVVLGAGEIGRTLGVRGKRGYNVATLEAAILGLLALMISFTFAMALSRYEARREAVLNEANAIGTVALRARLLPAPHNSNVLKLLREYVQVRLDVGNGALIQESLNAAINRSNAIQETLWQQAKLVTAQDKAIVPTGIFIQSLNEMIDNQGKRLSAAFNQIPDTVLLALYGIAAIATGFSGYASGLASKRTRLPVLIVGTLVCVVILLIEDIDRPYSGLIRVSQQPMVDTAASLSSYSE